MKKHHRPLLFGSVAAFVLFSVGAEAQLPPGGMVMPQTPYNLLTIKVNTEGVKVFASPEGRKEGRTDLIVDAGQLSRMLKDQVKAHPLTAPMANARGRIFDIFGLALDDPSALQTYQNALVRGGLQAADAGVNRAAADWLNAGTDAAAQTAAFAELRKAIAATGSDVPWPFWANLLQFKPANTAPAESAMIAYFNRYAGEEVAVKLREMKRNVQQLKLDGKPMVLEGTLVTGQHFSTAQWKGKVVYIDIWATWCAPCVVDLPGIQAMYTAHHAEGLEVVGLSCDESIAPLRKFLAANPEFTFPQIYDPVHNDFESDVSMRMGVQSLRVPLFIDRRGNLHYWGEKDETMEETAVRLLAEKP